MDSCTTRNKYISLFARFHNVVIHFKFVTPLFNIDFSVLVKQIDKNDNSVSFTAIL